WRIRSVSEWMPVGSVWPRFVLFFFSSRRRHTRLVSDWSSDVCSSDLDDARKIDLLPHETLRRRGCPGRQDDDIPDRKSVVEGKSVDLGGRRIIKKKMGAARGLATSLRVGGYRAAVAPNPG